MRRIAMQTGFPRGARAESIIGLVRGAKLVVLRGRNLSPGDHVEYLRTVADDPTKVIVRRISDGRKSTKDLTTLAFANSHANSSSDVGRPTVAPTPMPTTLKDKFVKFFREIGMNEEDKLAVESGLENPAGVPTQHGLEMVLQFLYRENRDKMIELVAASKKAAKKEKEEEEAEDEAAS